jgi:hypothetical protein
MDGRYFMRGRRSGGLRFKLPIAMPARVKKVLNKESRRSRRKVKLRWKKVRRTNIYRKWKRLRKGAPKVDEKDLEWM